MLNTGVCSSSLLQGIFPPQGSNPDFLHCRWILYQLNYQGSFNHAKFVQIISKMWSKKKINKVKTYSNKEYKRKTKQTTVLKLWSYLSTICAQTGTELILFFSHQATPDYEKIHEKFYKIILLNLLQRLTFKFKFNKLYSFCKPCICKLGL